jgi:hypothetical protein
MMTSSDAAEVDEIKSLVAWVTTTPGLEESPCYFKKENGVMLPSKLLLP